MRAISTVLSEEDKARWNKFVGVDGDIDEKIKKIIVNANSFRDGFMGEAKFGKHMKELHGACQEVSGLCDQIVFDSQYWFYPTGPRDKMILNPEE